MRKLKQKINEALASVIPITLIVFILSITIAPLPLGMMLMFLAGALLLVAGMGFFALGAELSMMPIGEGAGSELVKSRCLPIMILVTFAMGVIITAAEPDLTILAHQVPAVPDRILIWTVAAGVGIFLVLALLRTIFKLKLKYMLLILYAAVFILAYFTPDSFLAVAFDSGGVTTGPITVPFIMALGIGLARFNDEAHSQEESFGLVALCSIGPILAVLILGILYHPEGVSYTPFEMVHVETTQDVFKTFMAEIPHTIFEVGKALGPILIFFCLFQCVTRCFLKRQLIKIIIGTIYTFIGLVLFLCGVNVGFMPAGSYLGAQIVTLSYAWILIPIGMIIGYFIVKAEPAVHVLKEQVAEISAGTISARAMELSLSIGVALSLGIAMLRILSGINIMFFLLPGYALSLLLSFYVPEIFTAIAFDSGGVASGPMTATFLLPFAMGACEAIGGNVLTDAFGIVALVAMTPLLTIQLLGLIMKLKQRELKLDLEGDDQIINFEEAEL